MPDQSKEKPSMMQQLISQASQQTSQYIQRFNGRLAQEKSPGPKSDEKQVEIESNEEFDDCDEAIPISRF